MAIRRPSWQRVVLHAALWSLLAAATTTLRMDSHAQAAPGKPKDPAIDGRRLFLKNCAPCHGPDGRARTPAARKLGVKDLTVNRLEDAQVRMQIREGILSTGSAGKMPAFKDSLSEEELSALVSEVKRFRKPAGGE